MSETQIEKKKYKKQLLGLIYLRAELWISLSFIIAIQCMLYSFSANPPIQPNLTFWLCNLYPTHTFDRLTSIQSKSSPTPILALAQSGIKTGTFGLVNKSSKLSTLLFLQVHDLISDPHIPVDSTNRKGSSKAGGNQMNRPDIHSA